jgi:ATP-dependent Clp protease ATP-binding subunit ClpB
MEKHAVSRLIGAPPGYVGYDEGGYLTEAVRRRPYSVLLFDEIEKAHPEVFNVLLQILDDGRLTDGQGRTVDFRNAVLIMTSNLGSSYILEHQGDDWGTVEDRVKEALRQNFRPEFLNRIDDILVFQPLGKQELEQVVGMQLERLGELARERQVELEVTPAARRMIAEAGFDPAFGARPIKRAIQHLVSDPLAMAFLEGRFHDGDVIEVDAGEDDTLRFRRLDRPED